MRGRGRGYLTRQVSHERHFLKNKELYVLWRKINYRKQKIKEFQKEIEELENKLKEAKAKKEAKK